MMDAPPAAQHYPQWGNDGQQITWKNGDISRMFRS
jgi:hypothetical protein